VTEQRRRKHPRRVEGLTRREIEHEKPGGYDRTSKHAANCTVDNRRGTSH
jgi:hypothetical protein